jgi:hypothetical protein
MEIWKYKLSDTSYETLFYKQYYIYDLHDVAPRHVVMAAEPFRRLPPELARPLLRATTRLLSTLRTKASRSFALLHTITGVALRGQLLRDHCIRTQLKVEGTTLSLFQTLIFQTFLVYFFLVLCS